MKEVNADKRDKNRGSDSGDITLGFFKQFTNSLEADQAPPALLTVKSSEAKQEDFFPLLIQLVFHHNLLSGTQQKFPCKK